MERDPAQPSSSDEAAQNAQPSTPEKQPTGGSERPPARGLTKTPAKQPLFRDPFLSPQGKKPDLMAPRFGSPAATTPKQPPSPHPNASMFDRVATLTGGKWASPTKLPLTKSPVAEFLEAPQTAPSSPSLTGIERQPQAAQTGEPVEHDNGAVEEATSPTSQNHESFVHYNQDEESSLKKWLQQIVYLSQVTEGENTELSSSSFRFSSPKKSDSLFISVKKENQKDLEKLIGLYQATQASDAVKPHQPVVQIQEAEIGFSSTGLNASNRELRAYWEIPAKEITNVMTALMRYRNKMIREKRLMNLKDSLNGEEHPFSISYFKSKEKNKDGSSGDVKKTRVLYDSDEFNEQKARASLGTHYTHPLGSAEEAPLEQIVLGEINLRTSKSTIDRVRSITVGVPQPRSDKELDWFYCEHYKQAFRIFTLCETSTLIVSARSIGYSPTAEKIKDPQSFQKATFRAWKAAFEDYQKQNPKGVLKNVEFTLGDKEADQTSENSSPEKTLLVSIFGKNAKENGIVTCQQSIFKRLAGSSSGQQQDSDGEDLTLVIPRTKNNIGGHWRSQEGSFEETIARRSNWIYGQSTAHREPDAFALEALPENLQSQKLPGKSKPKAKLDAFNKLKELFGDKRNENKLMAKNPTSSKTIIETIKSALNDTKDNKLALLDQLEILDALGRYVAKDREALSEHSLFKNQLADVEVQTEDELNKLYTRKTGNQVPRLFFWAPVKSGKDLFSRTQRSHLRLIKSMMLKLVRNEARLNPKNKKLRAFFEKENTIDIHRSVYASQCNEKKITSTRGWVNKALGLAQSVSEDQTTRTYPAPNRGLGG